MRIPFSRNVRLAAIAGATALSLTTLSACGAGSSGSGGSGSKTLEMWTFKQSHVAALRNAAKAFKKQTGITVNVDAYTPDDAFSTKVQSSAKSGGLPDVLETHSDGDDRVFGAAGITNDIEDQYKGDWLDSIQPAVRNSGRVTDPVYKTAQNPESKDHGIKKGARYSVPLTVGTFGIVFANKRMLAAAGITRPPATWEEWIADLKATTGKNPRTGGLSLGLQVAATGLTWLLQPMAFADLGKQGYMDLFLKDKSKDFSSPNGIKVLDKYNELTPYWMPGTQTLTIDQGDQALAQGKSAFDVGGTFTLAFLEQNGMKDDNIMAFPLPEPKDAKVKDMALGPIALTSMSVTSTSKQPDNALKWMRFLSGPKVAAQFAKDSNDLPAAQLGAESASVLGPTLTALQNSFKGTPETTYDPNNGGVDFRAPGYEQDDAGAALADLTPLKRTSVKATADRLSQINQSAWSKAAAAQK
ncbi:ABC transporter substrate-binding protein [Streptomyces sp. 8L]|uniref:ABC transporter substrate-binding protein n=1 Tax=Streptomyces sp. 8L TaxID=2877242 RepID=UPI001CD6502D|nr:extracellular solute-binding protein [Streptomyces sp. 8L]MCA1217299.1 extracellular solute-binding protein [Streptomyces sp. 8L]